MSEDNYKHFIDEFLTRNVNVDGFIDMYMAQWKSDRDKVVSYDPKFQDLLDRIFTSCDCYYEKPQNPHEISEEELRQEIGLLRTIGW